MKYITDFLKGLQEEIKLFTTDKEFRKEGIKYLTSKKYLKKVVFVVLLGTIHGTLLGLIKCML